jgi:hypothetical protein
VVPNVRPYTICKRMFGDPLAYVRAKDNGVCLLALVYVHSHGLGFRLRFLRDLGVVWLQRNLGLVRLQLWA